MMLPSILYHLTYPQIYFIIYIVCPHTCVYESMGWFVSVEFLIEIWGMKRFKYESIAI